MTEIRNDLRVLLKCLIAMAASDGVLHDKEIEFIIELFRRVVGINVDRINVSDAYQDYLLNGTNTTLKILEESSDGLNDEMKGFIIKACYLMMISDGVIVIPESGKLAEIAAMLDIEEDTFAELIRDAAQIS